ncbi:MAG: hypothetical protein H6934_14330 [Burkholderiaceae bacterium]|nr:hypothetical protein [Burkholderiaceae bacterium]
MIIRARSRLAGLLLLGAVCISAPASAGVLSLLRGDDGSVSLEAAFERYADAWARRNGNGGNDGNALDSSQSIAQSAGPASAVIGAPTMDPVLGASILDPFASMGAFGSLGALGTYGAFGSLSGYGSDAGFGATSPMAATGALGPTGPKTMRGGWSFAVPGASGTGFDGGQTLTLANASSAARSASVLFPGTFEPSVVHEVVRPLPTSAPGEAGRTAACAADGGSGMSSGCTSYARSAPVAWTAILTSLALFVVGMLAVTYAFVSQSRQQHKRAFRSLATAKPVAGARSPRGPSKAALAPRPARSPTKSRPIGVRRPVAATESKPRPRARRATART